MCQLLFARQCLIHFHCASRCSDTRQCCLKLRDAVVSHGMIQFLDPCLVCNTQALANTNPSSGTIDGASNETPNQPFNEAPDELPAPQPSQSSSNNRNLIVIVSGERLPGYFRRDPNPSRRLRLRARSLTEAAEFQALDLTPNGDVTLTDPPPSYEDVVAADLRDSRRRRSAVAQFHPAHGAELGRIRQVFRNGLHLRQLFRELRSSLLSART